MSTYAIWNMVSNQITTTAPERDIIEREFYYPGFKRGAEQVICEFPDAMDLNIFNWREFPQSALFEGVQRYKVNKNASASGPENGSSNLA